MNRFYEEVCNVLKTYEEQKTRFTTSDVVALLRPTNCCIDVSDVRAVIREELNKNSTSEEHHYHCAVVGKVGSSNVYLIDSELIIVNCNDISFTKEKNILHFGFCADFTYDFITKKFNRDIEKLCFKCDNDLKLFLHDNNYKKIFNYEWLFNYVEDFFEMKQIVDYIPSEYLEKMPSGLFERINEENGRLTKDLFEEFIFTKKYGKYAKMVKENFGTRPAELRKVDVFLADYNLDIILKMVKNSILNGRSIRIYDVVDLYSIAVGRGQKVTLDENRDFQHNITLIRNTIDKEKNEILAKQLQRLNFINNLVIGDYIVVVPQSQIDKEEEGRMQNNCVGYYYDSSILRGENLIYFLRKVSNPKHSYITCRYNTNAKDTLEARKVNNRNINNSEETKIIKQISKLITEGLKD